MTGQTLGPYRVLDKIGEGGMGAVYLARDTKLNRDVALKVLPDVFAGDRDRLLRFEREAQVLASLNHPNVAAIYGLEEAEGVRALVLELVEGPTLADRIASGALPVDEALAIARRIADALDAAHERGVVHRDLKPANVKLTPDGAVKVLDFGLAKALAPDDASAANANSPTVISPARTERGVILGTAAYMSPEQARGRPVDKRADIWAFGVVLFEMLTGRKLFRGETTTEIIAAVIKDDIALDRLPPDVPPAIQRLLARCLERDPRQRLRDIGDARADLDDEPDAVAVPAGVGGWRWLPWIIAALATSMALTLLVMWRQGTGTARRPQWFSPRCRRRATVPRRR